MVNTKKSGIASDWSFAFNISETKYVTLAHQDDLYTPKYCEKCLGLSSEKSLITFTDYNEIFDGNLRDSNLALNAKRIILSGFYFFKKEISSILFKKLLLSFGNPVCCPSIMYNKQKIDYFKFNNYFSMNLDWEALLRISQINGCFVYIPQKLITRRIHKDSETTHALTNYIRHKEDKYIFNKLWPEFLSKILFKLYSKCYEFNE